MDESLFLDNIKLLLELAKANEGRLTKEDVCKTFAENIEDKDYKTICAYLTAKGVTVDDYEGGAGEFAVEESSATDSDEAYEGSKVSTYYADDLADLDTSGYDVMKLFDRCKEGDLAAREQLISRYLKDVREWVMPFAYEWVNEEDLLGNANISLVNAVDDVISEAPRDAFEVEALIREAVLDHMSVIMNEENEARYTGESVAGLINDMRHVARSLSKEGDVTLEAVAEYMHIDDERLELIKEIVGKDRDILGEL